MLPTHITLRSTVKEDLEDLFQFQLHPQARYAAAFTSKDMENKEYYIEKYTKLLANPTIHMRTIHAQGKVVGSIAKFVIENEAELTYWIDKNYWGQGIATIALQAFLKVENTRPLYARVAFDNYASQKVLEKCGFTKIGVDTGYAHERKTVIEEFIFKLIPIIL